MSVSERTGQATDVQDNASEAMSREWNWHPELPVRNSPLFSWPPNPTKIFNWYATTWLKVSERSLFALLAVAVWLYLQPALERCRDFEFGWIAQMYVRNLAIMIIGAGALHLYFCTFAKQDKKLKYDRRDQARNARSFSWNNQVVDNMFWSLASGVTVWTAYEVLLMWGYANELVPYVNFGENPVWFLLWFVVLPIWASFHFYWVHRLLHWPPLYRLAHSLHHRNVNVGPWSGLSMHPIEHVLYLSSVLIHWVVASHPIHVFFHFYWNTLGAATTHTGYEGLLIKDRNRFQLGAFFHQLHHRYFECNYGNADFPWDKWFGSFHNGSPEATEKVRERRRRMHGTGR